MSNDLFTTLRLGHHPRKPWDGACEDLYAPYSYDPTLARTLLWVQTHCEVKECGLMGECAHERETVRAMLCL